MNQRAFRHSSLLIVYLVLCATFLRGNESTWRSELYPEDWTPPHEREGLSFLEDKFLQDFSYAGYHRGEKSLPEIRSPAVDVVRDFGADASGESDATIAIQRAIDSVSEMGGGVVYLPAGTYRVRVPANSRSALFIRHPRVVLRGAGSTRTFLVNESVKMRGKTVILVEPAGGRGFRRGEEDEIMITRDYPGPTREIELENVEGLALGDWIVVTNPLTNEPTPEGSFVEDLRMTDPESGSWIGAESQHLWGTSFYRQIVGIDRERKIVRLDAPTRWYLLRRDGANVFRPGPFLEEIGLEHFSIGNMRHPGEEWGAQDYVQRGTPGHDVHNSSFIHMRSTRNSWIRAVHSFDPGNDNGAHLLSNGIVLDSTRGITMDNVQLGRAQYGGGGGNGYMIRLNSAQETLIRDSRAHHSRHGYAFWGMGTSGNVIYNSTDSRTQYQAGHTGDGPRVGGRGSDHHGHFSPSNLIDSCTAENSYFEASFRGRTGTVHHGQTSSQTVFWNTAGIGDDYDHVVFTEQFGWGYAIGTRGENPRVTLASGRPGASAATAPPDHVEGIGQGAHLAPFSLYLDQLQRRTSGNP